MPDASASDAKRRARDEMMRPEIQRAVEMLTRRQPQALEQALSLIQGTVYSFSMRVCGQREDAEDITQEVLVQSIPYLPKFDCPSALVVWLYKVAKSRYLMSRRRSKFAPPKELSLEKLLQDRPDLDFMSAPSSLNPESLAINRERAAQLREAIQRLPPQHRLVLVLRDMEGLTDPEVAELTGLRPCTVRVRLHRARVFVRKEVAQQTRENRNSATRTQAWHNGDPPIRPVQRQAMFPRRSECLDDYLTDALCDELVKHFDDCRSCRAFLATLKSTIQSVESPDRRKAAKARAEFLSRYTWVSDRLFGKRSPDRQGWSLDPQNYTASDALRPPTREDAARWRD